MSRGKIIIISGFSGVGKGTIIKNLMQSHPGEFEFSVSATTRKPRPGEVDGKDYYFVSAADFEEMIDKGALLEHARYGNNYYGTPAAPIDKILDEGKNVILDIEVNGMHQVTKKRPDVLTIFVIPPSPDELIKRLKGRGTESSEQLFDRLAKATDEARYASEYKFIIQNIDINKSTNEIEAYIYDDINDIGIRNANLILTQEICEGIKRYISKGEKSL